MSKCPHLDKILGLHEPITRRDFLEGTLVGLCFARTGRGQLCADQTSETCRAHLSCRTSGSRFRSKLPEGLGESFLSSGESDGSPSIPLDLRAS